MRKYQDELDRKVLLCFWNRNGVKNKFLAKDVNGIFNNKDIIIISETHFNIRSKCPNGFFLVGRSQNIKSTKPRGGVAVYKNNKTAINIKIISLDFRDCVVFETVDTNFVVVAMYIPPYNTAYYKDDYFHTIRIILDTLGSSRDIYIIGDLNSRIDNIIPHKGYDYKENPDKELNQHGRNLRRILVDHDNLHIVNGLIYKNRSFDSKFTFYRGNKMSQNDLCLTNNIENIRSFIILPKLIQSDHCPCVLNVNVKINYPLYLINDCASGIRNYDHYDTSKRAKRILKLENMNLTSLNDDLHNFGNQLRDKLLNNPDNSTNNICNEITESIYKCCIKNEHTKPQHLKEPHQKIVHLKILKQLQTHIMFNIQGY